MEEWGEWKEKRKSHEALSQDKTPHENANAHDRLVRKELLTNSTTQNRRIHSTKKQQIMEQPSENKWKVYF